MQTAVISLALIFVLAHPIAIQASEENPVSLEVIIEEISKLKALVAEQQRQIEELSAAAKRAAEPAPVRSAVVVQRPAEVEEVSKKVDALSTNLAGFKLGGDFRFRADVQARHGNNIAGPLQNLRSRYRVRLNADKDIDSRFHFHLQLSTGPYNNQTTNDQEFAGMGVKHPFSLAEAYVEYRPSSNVSVRGGRMEEVFADNMRFLWDDDVRFSGFQQTARIALRPGAFKSIEFRAGEYILSNPNVPVLASGSPFTSAGYTVGKRIGDANLFHPGIVVSGDLGSQWTHQAVADIQLYRNQNQIALESTAAGVSVVVNNAIGITLPGPVGPVGNATTTPGGAVYTAGRYQVARIAYRITDKGIKLGSREMPFFLDLQASRNAGTRALRDAVMLSANLGQVRQFGDMRFLYQFAIKDANSLIAQFTDDDLGTGATTNIAVHALRFDLGLSRLLQWQSLFFIQNARRANDPAQQFFVPLQRGAGTTYRYLGQLAFTF